jgi:hypothetical protein
VTVVGPLTVKLFNPEHIFLVPYFTSRAVTYFTSRAVTYFTSVYFCNRILSPKFFVRVSTLSKLPSTLINLKASSPIADTVETSDPGINRNAGHKFIFQLSSLSTLPKLSTLPSTISQRFLIQELTLSTRSSITNF